MSRERDAFGELDSASFVARRTRDLRGVGGLVRATAGVVRFAITASVDTAEWSAETTVRVTRFVARSAASGRSPGQVVDEALEQVRRTLAAGGAASGLLTTSAEPVSTVIADHMPQNTGDGRHKGGLTLPQMFDALLDASADVEFHYESHPAYFRLLNELDPDEARILRLFAQEGPQPAIDVRSKRIFGVGSRLLAPGITMIGAYAGLADKSRVPSYLNNLNRLGLIWFSREVVPDDELYHLLGAQPEVLEAFKGQKIDTVPRSIELTAFGWNLCALCGLMPAEEINARASVSEVERALPPPDAR
jgi:hypothetical protein